VFIKSSCVLLMHVMQAVGCCLFPSTDTVDDVPLEARWLFNDLTKSSNNDDITCTFIRPFTDKVSFQYMLIIFGFVWNCLFFPSDICIVAAHSGY